MQEPPSRAATTVPIDFLIEPANLRRLTITLVLVVCIAAAARDQSFPSPAAGLINELVANELTDRAQQRKWMYLIDKRGGSRPSRKSRVDTRDGPFYRLLAIDGTPLDPGQRQQDNARMDRLLHDPSQQLKFKRTRRRRAEAGEADAPDAGNFSLRLRRLRGKPCQAQIPPNSKYSPRRTKPGWCKAWLEVF
jgi:hypothetical protein